VMVFVVVQLVSINAVSVMASVSESVNVTVKVK